ncbi:MAG: 2-oxoglutarate dehydrogenase, E2 component, dihydrolipoamide succinyltransferase, partial [Actinobacteria bacterium]|nr:2-oxoglutarate dehydrogenase, E2 component, dihydrolipoamide succinyltransferase [Actinomycetota bacterium]
MTTTVSMPQLGESVTEGTVTRWLKQVGDTITADEPLLEVSTDKVDTEIPSPVSGVLLEIIAGEDAVVLVGGALGVIGEAGGAAAPAPTPAAEPVTTPVAAPVIEAPAVIDIPAPAPTVTAVSAGSGSNVSVVLPALGESVTEGTVTRWLKQIGDKVAVDEALLEVSTDKVDTEIPSPVEGVLLEITVAEDGVAQVGGQLGVIGSLAPASAAPAPSVPAPTPAPSVSAPAPAAPATAAPAHSNSADIAAANAGAYATPLVRRLAAERGVDLSTVVGTGVGGRIRKEDVLATNPTQVPVSQSVDRPVASTPAAPTPAAPAAPTTNAAVRASNAPSAPAAKVPTGAELRGNTVPMTRLRKVIAERMVESLQVSAQLTSVVEVDVTRIAALRNRSKNAFFEREGVKLSFLPFFAKAACEALKTFPVVNATIDQAAGTVTYFDSEHLGIAVDTERGLLVPVIHNAGDLNIGGLSRKIADLAERTRTNKLSPD